MKKSPQIDYNQQASAWAPSPGAEVARLARSSPNLSTQGIPLSDTKPQPSASQPIENNPSGPAGHRSHPEQSLALAMAAAKVCFDNFATDVMILDMTQKTALFDYFVIATGTSRRHLHALSEEIDHMLQKQLNDKRISREGYDESRWIVLDYGNVVIHLFDEETRQYYGLEVLHSDAPKLDVAHLAPKPGSGPASS
ncbi:MAG: ribosome silencing factor [Pirellulaceae bacterium]|nr:ribosome silencing factor [Pirellulaceae bacterium]